MKVDKDTPSFGVNTFYSEGNVVEEIGNLVESYSSEFNYTSNYVSVYKNDEYNIAIYKNISCLVELSIDMPIIDFQNCYEKIKNEYNISEELIIAIVDRLDQDNPNTSYSIYHPVSGEKLDAATICKNETILVTENHYIDENDPEYDLKMSLIKQNINIFDSENSFFKDICFDFNNSKKRDIALSDRIKYYYQNTNLCDGGCKQISFDLNTQTAKCDCQYNDIEKQESNNNELIKENEILDAVAGDVLEFINSSNIFIVKCYKYIFRYITNSFGAIISLILLCFNIIFTILFFLKEFPKLKIYIYNLTEKYILFLSNSNINFPPKRAKQNKNKMSAEEYNHNIKTNIDNKMNEKSLVSINSKDKNNTNDLIITFKSSKFKPNNKINDKISEENKSDLEKIKNNKQFFKEYLETSLDDLEFDDAIVKDQRKFCEYFCDNFKDKQTLANTFFASDPIKTRSIKIILFIFDIILNFVINALFISEDYISMLYHLEKQDSFFTFIPRSISRFIKTTIVGEVIGYITSFFFIEEAKIKSFFKREKDNKKALKENVIILIKEIKKRYLPFIIIVFVIIIISLFYLLCFNYVYPYTQMEWIKTSIMVIMLRQILSCLIILLEAILRFLSFKMKSEKMYKFSKVFS